MELEESLHNILKVNSVCLIPQHAVCERGFSTMKRVKTDWRSCLKSQTLEKLMHISIDGVPLKDFDPLRAIQDWWADGTRTRRPNVSDILKLKPCLLIILLLISKNEVHGTIGY